MKNDLLPCPFCEWGATEHYLKTVEPYYSDIEQGYKEFDVRRRDRPFDVGDTLILQQYIDGRLTGKKIRRKVKYILLDENFVKEGYCVLGLENTRPEPEPRVLTVEELREMNGKPVWVEQENDFYNGYYLVDSDSQSLCGIHGILVYDSIFADMTTRGKVKVFDRQPKED